MTRVAAALILIGTLGAAGVFFYLGLTLASGEDDYVYWAIRGPLWGLSLVAALMGCAAAWLALRSDPS